MIKTEFRKYVSKIMLASKGICFKPEISFFHVLVLLILMLM